MKIEEYLLAYPGFSAEPGICHLIVAGDAPGGPAVLIGDLEGNPGTSPTNALERVASAIAQRLFDGQLAFRLYQYEPEGLPDRSPTFYSIAWQGAHPGSMPTWNPINPASDAFLARAMYTVQREPYTLRALAGRPVIDATESANVVTELRGAMAGS